MIDILLIVAHPDDEVIWFGSSLYELIRLGDINVNVINLWGILEPPGSMQAVTPGYKDIDRKEQFYEVCKNMNYSKYHIITDVDTPVYKRMPQTDENILREFNKALNIINLNKIDLIVTHSYYGDEHKHPGHIITHRFSKNYADRNNIPFSFFSMLQIPNITHKSLLRTSYRKNDLHILNFSQCDNGLYYIQFQGNLKKKLESLKLYKAVDFQKHYDGYIGFSMVTEGLYFEKDAMNVIKKIVKKMDIICDNIL